MVSSSCSSSRSSGLFSFSFFWVLLLVVIYDDNRMGGVFDFFIIINMSSWSSRSSASSSTCTSCSLVLLGGSAISTLPYVWLTCAFGHNKRGETQLVCWCAFIEWAWCPAWNQRRRPGAHSSTFLVPKHQKHQASTRQAPGKHQDKHQKHQ